QDLLELLGRPERELLAAEVEDLELERVSLALDPIGDRSQALGVELESRQLHLAEYPDERKLHRLEKIGETTALDLLALPLCERPGEQRVGGCFVLDVGSEAALLREFAEGIRAPRRLEQVSGDLRVVGEVGGNPQQRLRVVGNDRPGAERGDD